MDRAIVYAGAIPLDSDLLRVGRYAKEGIGRLAQTVFGAGTIAATGFACALSSSDLSVTIDAGSILAPGCVDWATFGASDTGLEADSTELVCQFNTIEKQTLTFPGTGANYTIYALCSEDDVDLTVMPFYNVANPSHTQLGINNNGQPLPARRSATMRFQAATAPPPATAGVIVVPLYTIAVPAGAGSLAGLQAIPSAVFLPTLSQLATQTLVRDVADTYTICTSSGVVAIPLWANRVEIRAIGGGGGGGFANVTDPANGSFSGSGGGAGGDAWGVYTVEGDRLNVTVGAGGSNSTAGTTSLVTYRGTILLQANGGGGGAFYATQGSAGAAGGSASGGTIWNLTGGSGADGQCGRIVFAGHGAGGPWGGGGRAGNQGGSAGNKYGAGGGGSYSTTSDGVAAPGGVGYQGCVLYRFLP